MIRATRWRLTFTFTILLITFLILFNIASYFLLNYLILKQREVEIQVFTDQEVNEHAAALLERETDDDDDDSDDDSDDESDRLQDVQQDSVTQASTLLPFYSVLDASGLLIYGNAPNTFSSSSLPAQLETWQPTANETRYFTVPTSENHQKTYIFAKRYVYNGKGKLLGTVITGADISQQKEILQRLMKVMIAMSGVFLAVALMIGYLMSGPAIKPLMNAWSRQRQFISDASHELRTPLAVIHSSVEVIEDEQGQQLSPYTRQLLHDIKDEVLRLSNLTQDLLFLAQVDAKAIVLQLEPVQLNELVESVHRKLISLAHRKQIELKLETEDDSIEVLADPNRLQQLLIILLDNAIQYTNENGTVVTSLTRSATTVNLLVRDTGIGIANADLPYIFDRFSRIDRARSRSFGNAGLGLAIAKWIAEAHNGSLTVESISGKGTTFTFSWPRK